MRLKKKDKTMKKMMIAMVAVALATVANAASVTWGSGTIYLANGDKAGKSAVTGYLFLVDAATYATYSSMTDGKALSDAIYSAYGKDIATADASKSTTAKGIANIADPTAYSNGSTAYGVILYVEGDNYMGNFATYTFESDLDGEVGALSTTIGGDIAGGTNATAWSTAAVPEPTSGLLLLLGMAGLALRRKSA
jgi:hypothetical protein